MIDTGSIAKVVHDIDKAIQEKGGEPLTEVQKLGVIVDLTVAAGKLGKSPEELVSKTLDSYEGNVFEAARNNYSRGMGRAA